VSPSSVEILYKLKYIMSVKLNYYCTLYYYSLIYEPCLYKHACFFISTAMSWNLSAFLKISLSYQAVYQYLLDNPVSRPSFVPTIIAALHPSNRLWAPVCPNLLWCSQATSVNRKDLTSLPTCWELR